MKNKKGSTIVWAITLIMILVVIVGAALSFAYISYNKAIQYKSKTQAELTAQSVAQALVDQINKASATSTDNFEEEDQIAVTKTLNLIPSIGDNPTIISENEISIENSKMGKVNSITITRNQNNKLTITVKTTYSNQESAINAIMKKDKETQQWSIYNYERAKS